MTDTKTLTPLGRVLCLALLGGAAAALSGCADGPGNGGTTSGTSGGTTSGTSGGTTGGSTGGNGSCPSNVNCPVVTVLLDNQPVDNLPDASGHAQATWTSTNTDTTAGATPCTPSGGLGTANDPWTTTGPFAYQSTNFPDVAGGLTEQPAQNGVYTFVLTCINVSGDGASAGAATLNIGPINGNPSPITVNVNANPSSIILGDASTVSWSAVDSNGSSDPSISCTHTSNPIDPTWNGASSAASGSVVVTPTAAVIYTYVLTCTNAAGGSGAGATALTVAVSSPSLVQCPAGQTFTPFRNATVGDNHYSATAAKTALCVGCTVLPDPPTLLVDAQNTLGSPVRVTVPVDLLDGNVTLKVTDNFETIVPLATGSVVGYIISRPDAGLLSLDVLQNISVRTLAADGSTIQVGGRSTDAARLDLLGLFGDPNRKAVVFNATLPFKALEFRVSGLVDALSSINVFQAGICLPAGGGGSTSGGTTGG